MVRTPFRVLVSVVALCATVSGASVKFTSTWKAPGVTSVALAGQKVAALVMTGDQNLRVSAEEALARELTARGVQGVAAYRIIPKEELTDKDKAKGWFERSGVQGVVVLRPVSVDKKKSYSPVMWSSGYYNTFWDYYGYGWYNLYDYSNPTIDTIVAVETLIYSVPKNQLLWAGMSNSTNPKDSGKLIKDLVAEAADQMKKQKLIAVK